MPQQAISFNFRPYRDPQTGERYVLTKARYRGITSPWCQSQADALAHIAARAPEAPEPKRGRVKRGHRV